MHASALAPSSPNEPVTVGVCSSPSEWNTYVGTHPLATGCHRYEWDALIGRVFGHETRYLAAQTRVRVHGVLPLVVFRSRVFGRHVVSMPFLNYGGVVADSPVIERLLLDEAIAVARRENATLELRHTRRVFPALAERRHKVAMTMAVSPDPDAMWNGLDRKVRNLVRKAEKSGLRVLEGGIEWLDAFYEVFARNMRDLGTPVYTKRFFRAILETFSDSSRVFAIYAGDIPVAGSLVLLHRDVVEVPWASSLRAFSAQAPNMLLYWRMLRFASERRFRTFDFGRSTPGEGTFHFKRQWGAQPSDLVWEYWSGAGALPDLSPKNPKFRHAIAVWQRLPVSVTNRLGPYIVRNIP